MKTAIYGCGGFGREVAPLAVENGAEVLFVSDNPREHGEVAGHACVGLDDVPDGYRFVVAIADGAVRKRLSDRCRARGLEPTSIISRTARFLGQQSIGEEAVICDGVIITDNVRVGRGFHCNLLSYIGHDCEIGDFVTLGPRTGLSGNTVVGNGAHIATGASLRHGYPGNPLIIGEQAYVGMGAVVTKSVPPGTVVIGNPARPMRKVAAA